jgi:hypothetical protein
MIEVKELVKTVLISRQNKEPSSIDAEHFGKFASAFIKRLSKPNTAKFEGEVMLLVDELLKENNNDH